MKDNIFTKNVEKQIFTLLTMLIGWCKNVKTIVFLGFSAIEFDQQTFQLKGMEKNLNSLIIRYTKKTVTALLKDAETNKIQN